MKTKYIYLLLAGIFALMSCEEDATPILELKTAAALHALSQTDITITKDNKDAQFPEIAWDKADYGVSAVVNYVVTLTNTSTNKSIVIGETGDAKLAFTSYCRKRAKECTNLIINAYCISEEDKGV